MFILTKDPILTAIRLRLQRLAMFLVLSALMGLVVFSAVLLMYFDQDWRDIWPHLRAAWMPADDILHDILLRGSAIIGVLVVIVIYLLTALWWRDTGAIHRRGTRLRDDRDRR